MVNVNKDAIGGDAIGTADSFWAAWPLPALTFWNHNWSQIRTPLGHQVYKIRWRYLFQLTCRETVRKEPRRKAKRNILGGCNKKVSYRKQIARQHSCHKKFGHGRGHDRPCENFPNI